MPFPAGMTAKVIHAYEPLYEAARRIIQTSDGAHGIVPPSRLFHIADDGRAAVGDGNVLATMLVAYADKLFTTQMAVAGGHDCLTPGFVEHCERMPS